MYHCELCKKAQEVLTEENEREEVKDSPCILDIRDHISNIQDLLTLCIECLSESELIKVKDVVVSVLYFHVKDGLTKIDQELKDLWNK